MSEGEARPSLWEVVQEPMMRAREALEDVTILVDSLRLGCEIAYRREPTQAEGDANACGSDYGADECFVPMGGHHGWKCKCGTWVFGGPTVCHRCVDADAVKAALEWKAEAVRLRKLFDDAGQGEHNVLALVDHYQEALLEERARLRAVQGELSKARERISAVYKLLEENVCTCPCNCVMGDHEPDCEVCFACRIADATGCDDKW